jgi:mRNA degradation ribonuclease J1/J2
VFSVAYYQYIQRHSEKLIAFCDNINFGERYNKIYQLAKKQDLEVPFFSQSPDQLTIFNQAGPLFKISCEIDFSDGKAYKIKLHR